MEKMCAPAAAEILALTNVARRSPALGVATLVLDAGKGLAAVLLARIPVAWAKSDSAHNGRRSLRRARTHVPVVAEIRGGKGVATSWEHSHWSLLNRSSAWPEFSLSSLPISGMSRSGQSVAAALLSGSGLGVARIRRATTTTFVDSRFPADYLEAPAKPAPSGSRNGIELGGQ